MKKYIFCILFMILSACNENHSDLNGIFNSSNPGYLALGFTSTQSFNPNTEHGRIKTYRLTLASSALETPIIKYFDANTKEAAFEGFPDASHLSILIEALNANNVCVRRGRSDNITIKGGQTASALVTIANVPIFANVRDGAIVYNNRFVPKVFAPGAITFSVTDSFADRQAALADTATGETQFSISEGDETSVKIIYTETLEPGDHQLTAVDTDTEESSTVNITVRDGSEARALTTSAGGYVGTSANDNNHFVNNMIVYNNWQIQIE